MVAVFYGLSHATVPSFAPRVTVVGEAYHLVKLPRGKDHVYQFALVPHDGRKPVGIQTGIILPSWADPERFDGRTLRVTYLEGGGRPMDNEGIDIEILQGYRAGFHEAVDARPLGSWLGVPLGAAVAAFGYLGIRYAEGDEKAAFAADDAAEPIT